MANRVKFSKKERKFWLDEARTAGKPANPLIDKVGEVVDVRRNSRWVVVRFPKRGDLIYQPDQLEHVR